MCLAVPGLVKSIRISDDPLLVEGEVDFGGVTRTISLGFVPEVEVGHYVIVHAGAAISVLDESEAHLILAEYLRGQDEYS